MGALEMVENLQRKYENILPLTQEEIEWCVYHLADVNSAIRDELCYNVLAQAILEGVLTREQIRWIIEFFRKTEALFYQIEQQDESTVYRSFIALVWAVLVQVDGDETSHYYEVMYPVERQYIFVSSWLYLKKERDMRGYVEEYGWVHAIAHGADLLAAVVAHPLFRMESSEEILNALVTVLQRMEQPFVDEEEMRLGLVIVAGLLNGKITQSHLANWIEQQKFYEVDGTNLSYYRYAAYKRMLATVYFRLEVNGTLEELLKRSLLEDLQYI